MASSAPSRIGTPNDASSPERGRLIPIVTTFAGAAELVARDADGDRPAVAPGEGAPEAAAGDVATGADDGLGDTVDPQPAISVSTVRIAAGRLIAPIPTAPPLP